MRVIGVSAAYWSLPGPALLFCPASRPERFGKAAAAADVLVLDLEDSVAPAAKEAARDSVMRVLASGRLNSDTTMVRVNGLNTAWGRDDLIALRASSLRTVMLPMAERCLPEESLGDLGAVAICESARGVLTALDLADSPRCVGLAWGGQDLAANLGAPTLGRARGNLHRSGEYARMAVRYAAAAANIPAIDAVRTDIEDDKGLAGESRQAAELGYAGKLVIHPRQVPIVRASFRPTDEALGWARRVIAGFADGNEGVVLIDGEMVDTATVGRAVRLLALVGESGHPDPGFPDQSMTDTHRASTGIQADVES